AVEAQRACVATVEALHKELVASGTREEALKCDNKRLVHDLGVITAAYDELQHKVGRWGLSRGLIGGWQMRRVSDAASSLRAKLRSLEEENAALRGKVDLLEEKNRRESTSTRALRSSRKRAEAKLQEVQAENRSLRES
ncbi:hypothetical protein FOZ63_021894, partial [Perkinsus olseni]